MHVLNWTNKANDRSFATYAARPTKTTAIIRHMNAYTEASAYTSATIATRSITMRAIIRNTSDCTQVPHSHTFETSKQQQQKILLRQNAKIKNHFPSQTQVPNVVLVFFRIPGGFLKWKMKQIVSRCLNNSSQYSIVLIISIKRRKHWDFKKISMG